MKCKKFKIDGKGVLAFYIPLADKKPVYYHLPKNSFIRCASGDQRLSDSEVDSLYRDSAYGTKDKEKTPFGPAKLKKETLNRYIEYLKSVNKDHAYSELPRKELLEKLRIIDSGKVTIGGLLAFGTDSTITHCTPDFRIDYLEIMGTSYSDAVRRYEFRLSEYDNVYEYSYAIWERLRKKVDIPFEMRGPFRYEDQPQVRALREALINLLIHSDYFSPMKPRIRVFSDRIEFLNPGALPQPYEELRKGDISLPRNPILAKNFRVINLAENAGYGFDKMFDGWVSHYAHEPIVGGGVGYYVITFPLAVHSEGDASVKILEIMRQNRYITIPELAQKIGVTERSIERNIHKLQKENKLKRKGPDKGGHWEVLECST